VRSNSKIGVVVFFAEVRAFGKAVAAGGRNVLLQDMLRKLPKEKSASI